MYAAYLINTQVVELPKHYSLSNGIQKQQMKYRVMLGVKLR